MKISDFESAYNDAGCNALESYYLRDVEEETDPVKREILYKRASRASACKRIPIGYWYSKYRPKLPKPEANSSLLSSDEIEKICKYLNWEKHGNYHTLGFSDCRICEQENGNSCTYDDKYIWPSGLSHYLKDHNCELPDEFVDYCLHEFEKLK